YQQHIPIFLSHFPFLVLLKIHFSVCYLRYFDHGVLLPPFISPISKKNQSRWQFAPTHSILSNPLQLDKAEVKIWKQLQNRNKEVELEISIQKGKNSYQRKILVMNSGENFSALASDGIVLLIIVLRSCRILHSYLDC